ncbi:MAG: hypothetical protein KDC53_17035 [Saprospiraceae bacterium]|nr:hypothetical protein [Saprospiraceae bacterium]
MFKAKLIGDKSYFRLKRITAILSVFSIVLFCLINPVNELSWPWLIVLCTISGVIIFYSKRIEQRLIRVIQDQIQIDYESITIVDNRGKVKDKINISDADRIILKETFKLPLDKIADKHLKNFITIDIHNKLHTFDFIPESYYMLKQLGKIVERWRESNIPLFILPLDQRNN